MFWKQLLCRIVFSPYDYQSVKIDPDNVRLAVIHIPDQIGDAMAVFPAIRALERQRVAQLIIVASALNKPVFDDLHLEQTKLTVLEMTFQDRAGLGEINAVAKHIRETFGAPDLCIEGMRNINFKTMTFIRKLKARTNFQVVGLTLRCFSDACQIASRMDQFYRAPVPMTWSIMMREAGFPVVVPRFELPLGDETRQEVQRELDCPGRYVALNFEGSVEERTFTLDTAKKLIGLIRQEFHLPIVIVHSPRGTDSAIELAQLYDDVYRLYLPPSIKRSAAIISRAFIAITPDTSILHIASAFNIPTVAIYANYKTRWPAMQDIVETIVVGKNINHINYDEFTLALRNLSRRLDFVQEEGCQAPANPATDA